MEGRLHGISILQIGFDQLERSCRLLRLRPPTETYALASGGVVVRVDVVKTHHGCSLLQQPAAEVVTNKTCSTGYQNSHASQRGLKGMNCDTYRLVPVRYQDHSHRGSRANVSNMAPGTESETPEPENPAARSRCTSSHQQIVDPEQPPPAAKIIISLMPPKCRTILG